jgi:hypothetical protein
MNGPLSYSTTLSPLSIDEVQVSVLRILLYFDIFKHPLKAEEIAKYSEFGKEGLLKVQAALTLLSKERLIKSKDSYYFLSTAEDCVDRRIKGEQYAKQSLRKARKYSRLISAFPFVRGICLSGSISKLYMDKEADIDYFVITSPGRMWIARTLLVLFKKLFLLNSKKYFCVNYFVTEESLSIPNKNIFTATELAFLIPTYSERQYKKLMDANEWYREYYPKFSLRDNRWMIGRKKYFIKPFLEKILSGKTGGKIDDYFFRLTLNHWKKKFPHFNSEKFDLRLRSRKNESKHHPLGYQERILSQYEHKLCDFESRYSVKLHT